MSDLSKTYANLAAYNRKRAAQHASAGDWDSVCRMARAAVFHDAESRRTSNPARA